MLTGLLEKRVEKRLSGSACLTHPWLLTIHNMEDTILDTARLRGSVILQYFTESFF
jgi:hypothetical protein